MSSKIAQVAFQFTVAVNKIVNPVVTVPENVSLAEAHN
jgi:hypothetical protein